MPPALFYITLRTLLFIDLSLRFTEDSDIEALKDISTTDLPFTLMSNTTRSSSVKLHSLRKRSHSRSVNPVLMFVPITPSDNYG